MTIKSSTYLLFGVLSGTAISAAGGEPSYEEYGRLLEKYVTPEGVRYEQWHESPEDVRVLDAVLENFSRVSPSALSDAEAAAFLINLYNAGMIQIVLEHYPLETVRSIGLLPFAVFRKNFISLDGDNVSLDEIEKEILLKKYFDPRLHFAVNCASESCPPLLAEPFTGAQLDEQLEERTRRFANSDRAARVAGSGKATAYSELFKWYDEDFPGDDPAVYLNRYREDPLPEGNAVRWIDYDWSLNEAD